MNTRPRAQSQAPSDLAGSGITLTWNAPEDNGWETTDPIQRYPDLDGGNAEQDSGVNVGDGIVVVDPPSGLAAKPDGRMLLVHERNTFEAV